VAFLTYEAGPLQVGIMSEYFGYHRGPESQRLQVDRLAFPTSDVTCIDGGVFLKYFNGRYFLNAELDWINRITRFQRSQDGTFFGTPDRVDGTGSLFAPRYIEAWRWMVETGFVAGPVKASFIYAWLPGPDRRRGVLIDRQTYFYGFGNNGVFMPYSLVLNFYYGAGLGLFNLNTDGFMNDASILAARIDYAVAANLNVYSSLFWANRASGAGYGWGFMRPAATGSSVQFLNLSTINAATPDAPSIPDNSLGWEIDAGIEWQLLDKWTVRLAAGYWQPGRWFNYACVDKTVPNWDIPTPANQFGVNPNRVIDPVVAIRIFLTVEF
jgi:opacity protein-like surface antigen